MSDGAKGWRLPLWFVLGLVAAAYGGVPQAGFVWDDHALVEHNRVLTAPTFENVFLRDLWCCTVSNDTGYYRPLLTLTFLLDRWLFGVDAAGSHVQSLLWHLLVVALVAGVLRGRVGATRANVAALIFGLHPVQSEAVVWISARNDLMAAAGVLGTLLALDRRKWGLAALAAFSACLSKENAFLLPAVIFVWRRAWGERLARQEVVAIGLALAAAFALRSQATLGGFTLEQAEISFNARSAFYGAVTMLGWVTWPWPLTTTASLYMPAPHPAAWPAAVATLLLFAGLLRAGRARAAWLLLLAAGVFAPSAFGVRWYGTLGERYLYLPLFGLVAAIVATAPARRAQAPALAVATLAALGVLHVRVPDWADEEALFTAAVRRSPDGYAWNLLGVELMRQERWAEATGAFDAAIGLVPLQRRACRHVVVPADHVLGDADLVARTALWAERGCKGRPGFDGARAMALASRGLWAEAEVVARDARRNDPGRRDEIVRAALDARDGDLASLGARALAWPSGAADLLDQASYLVQARPADAGPVAAP